MRREALCSVCLLIIVMLLAGCHQRQLSIIDADGDNVANSAENGDNDGGDTDEPCPCCDDDSDHHHEHHDNGHHYGDHHDHNQHDDHSCLQGNG